ncbi:MAG TPA: methyltransferase domain-containing protein [Bryobacteraceae bacterium]|nr:methyltransferase domain-containing protein [Bryobacteraceae bacterium]
MSTVIDLQTRVAELGPWFYDFDLGGGVVTPSSIPPEVRPIFRSRLEMVNGVVRNHFGPRLRDIRCLDVGCHEGFYSVAMSRTGVGEVVGVDVRPENLARARFVAETLGLRNIRYEQANCEELSPEAHGRFELTLFLGILYHLENPMLCLRRVAAMTTELCVVETQVVDESEGVAEWGARAWTRPFRGVLALIDESAEYYDDIAETGATPLATCPSPVALRTMLRHAGFSRIEMIDPPPGAYEQLARRKRVVCAAWK